jgi:hypothetical protein
MISSGSIPSKVDRRGAEVGVPELALHGVERHVLAGTVERVGVAELGAARTCA